MDGAGLTIAAHAMMPVPAVEARERGGPESNSHGR
jgi:hypothetical protein